MTDILVALIDLVHQLRDVHAVGTGIGQTLVQTLLQGLVGLLLLCQLVAETCHASLGGGQLLLGVLVAAGQLSVLCLAVLQFCLTTL